MFAERDSHVNVAKPLKALVLLVNTGRALALTGRLGGGGGSWGESQMRQ
jgi:hypothetical protein